MPEGNVPEIRSGEMHNLDDVTRLPDDFDGRVCLFPLPDLVLFPHAMQPLHIFEPRYCEMLAESLQSDRLIAMATLTGGLAATATSDPPIATNVCLGKIISHAEVEDDRHNVLLVGMRRAKIIEELEAGRSFRMAEVDVAGDVYPPSGAEARMGLKRDLLEAFGEVIPSSASVQQSLHELMAGQMSLGPITDIISYTLPFEVEDKLRLLADSDVDSRAIELVRLLRSGSIQLHSVSSEELSSAEQNIESSSFGDDDGDRFPPPFSLN